MDNTQAEEFRRPYSAAVPRKRRNIIAIASGKSGLGKTWLAVSLAHALSLLRKKTLLFDADLGLANTAAQIGLTDIEGLESVINAQKSLNQIVYSYDKGRFDIISGGSGLMKLSEMPIGRLQILGEDLSTIAEAYDTVVLDTGAGVKKSMRALAGLAAQILVICTDEPSAQTEAYGFIKIMAAQYPHSRLGIVVNQADSLAEGRRTYETVNKACVEFLRLSPPLMGIIRRDTRVRDAIRSQNTILSRYPTSEAASDVINLAERLSADG